MTTAFEEVVAVRGHLTGSGGSPAAGEVTITGSDPVLSTRFRIGETCAAVLGGVGVAVSDLWELRTDKGSKTEAGDTHALPARIVRNCCRRLLQSTDSLPTLSIVLQMRSRASSATRKWHGP